MKYSENILGTIGNTPLVKINKITKDVSALVLAKVETFNPGHSIKDRMALKMVEVAEQDGRLKPGGTIIECTSGNTGMGLAMAGIIKGYRCIFTTSDKQSPEKFDLLRALGAEVHVCPTAVAADDPRSYYSVAERLHKEIPNSFWVNQYDNPANAVAHYESTGPEIWEQTEGKVTHLVVGVGTGGTISGTAKYLKEKNPNIKVWGIDTYGSVFKKYHETGEFDEKEIYSYITEGIGEDILPENVDFSVIDKFEKVTDKDGAVYARRIAREEGIMVGYSAGSAIAGVVQLKDELKPSDVVVVIFHDHGSRYIGKLYNDDWMKERGFLEGPKSVEDLINTKHSNEFITVGSDDKVRTAFNIMKDKDLSQLPVMKDGAIVGSLTERLVLNHLLENPIIHAEALVEQIMQKPFPTVNLETTLTELTRFMDKTIPAVIVEDKSKNTHIVTNYDLIRGI